MKARTEIQQRVYERKKRWRQENPEKAKAAVDNFYRKNPGARQDKHLRKKYGLSKEQYHNALASQLGQCAVCCSDTPQRNGSFIVDHCHKTGKVRGIVCHRCNVALAMANDDPQLLRALADYLEVHRG